jgi:hypothetical protein
MMILPAYVGHMSGTLMFLGLPGFVWVISFPLSFFLRGSHAKI